MWFHANLNCFWGPFHLQGHVVKRGESRAGEWEWYIDVAESCFYVLSLFVCCFVVCLMKSRVRPMRDKDLFLLAGVANCVASVDEKVAIPV